MVSARDPAKLQYSAIRREPLEFLSASIHQKLRDRNREKPRDQGSDHEKQGQMWAIWVASPPAVVGENRMRQSRKHSHRENGRFLESRPLPQRRLGRSSGRRPFRSRMLGRSLGRRSVLAPAVSVLVTVERIVGWVEEVASEDAVPPGRRTPAKPPTKGLLEHSSPSSDSTRVSQRPSGPRPQEPAPRPPARKRRLAPTGRHERENRNRGRRHRGGRARATKSSYRNEYDAC